MIAARGTPEAISVDNGPEFAGGVLDEWAHTRGVSLRFIRPGRRVENAYIESFNGKFRDECLDEHLFASLAEAQVMIDAWRLEYNLELPHSSLGNIRPAEFDKAWRLAPESQIKSIRRLRIKSVLNAGAGHEHVGERFRTSSVAASHGRCCPAS